MTADRPSADFIEGLVAAVRSTLGSDLVAMYLYGSAVTGGFDAEVSDIDLLVVTEHDLDQDAVAPIEALHDDTIDRHPEWKDRLELAYVGRSTLAAFRDGGPLGVISPGEPFHLRDGADLWLQNFYLVRETGVTLVGAGPTTTIPDISWPEFLTATRRYAAEVRGRNLAEASPRARAYSVLTLCRALCTVQSNRACSKQEGAAWVRKMMPGSSRLIDAAELCRMTGGRRGFDDDETLAAAKSLLGRLAADIHATDGADGNFPSR